MKRTFLSLFMLTTCACLPGYLSAISIDFDTDASGNTIQAGQIIDDEYAAFGVHISVQNNYRSFDIGATFDTENPTGGDWDLGSGAHGYHPTNTTALGNVLIIAENNYDSNHDGYLDSPDDQAGSNPGYIDFAFDDVQQMGEISLLDIEESGGRIEFRLGGNLLSTQTLTIPGLGDNSFQTIYFGNFEFDHLRVLFAGSGAVASMQAAVPEPGSLMLVTAGIASAAAWRRKKQMKAKG